jgi:methylated-DNA-protein-cysteine methyltransferase-like protein
MNMFNPPDPKAFHAIVWEIVQQIPAGRVSTYGQIASMIPPPEGVEPPSYDRLAPRWVGNAMNAVSGSNSTRIPWQRVINAKGAISLPEGSKAADEQRARLEAEGVTFDEAGRVDFNLVGWDGPNEAWLRARNLLPPRPLGKRPSGKPGQPSLL